MDYGHTGQNDSGSPVFFTSGAGTNSENVNNFEPENNLDLSNGAWDASPKGDIDPRGLGKAAIMQSREASRKEHAEHIGQNQESGLGEIIELGMPPGSQDSSLESLSEMTESSLSTVALPDLKLLKEENGRISPQTLHDTERAVKKFEEGVISPAELDNARWEGTKAYLKNSFGRDIAA